MYREVAKCRACGYGAVNGPGGTKAAAPTERLVPVLDLGVQPLANDFKKGSEERHGHAPLKVLHCPRCNLAQLSVVVRPDILYSNYAYVTSPSATMLNHFRKLTDDILEEVKPGPAIEVGSNNGAFLEYLAGRGFGNVVGIDPAKNITKDAKVMTVHDFFNKGSAESARSSAGEPVLIVARHVFCHVDDWAGFMENIHRMAGKETLMVIEVPYVADQLASRSFDQVYHEHLSYLNVGAVAGLLEKTPLRLHRVCHYDIHGGSVAVMIRRHDSAVPTYPSVSKYLDNEKCREEQWREFSDETEFKIVKLRELVRGLRLQGKRVCGYGASAKATVWINACGFTKADIEMVCDSTAHKVGCTVPGTDIPVVNEGDHFTGCFDYVVLFAWNFAAEIMERERKFNHAGFKWIIPVPNLEVVDA